jgi:hypothetical protein
LHSPVVIFKPDDIVLSEIGPSLNLNEGELNIPNTLNSVGCLEGNVHRLARLEVDLLALEDDPGPALHDDPMLGSLEMLLIAQTLSGIDPYPFDPI